MQAAWPATFPPVLGLSTRHRSLCTYFESTGLRTPLSSYRASVVHQSVTENRTTKDGIQYLTEKCIGQRNSINALHGRVLRKIGVDKEENRHIHRLPSVELLLLETETLNLAEVRRYLTRSHTVGRNAYDVRGALVGRRVECKRSLSGKNTDLSLLRGELPG